MKGYRQIGWMLAAGLLASAAAQAADITIFDNMTPNATFGTDARGLAEDNETEYNTICDQTWDLEAFYLTGSALSMVGGWDFVNGIAHDLGDYGIPDVFESGDVFLSLGPTAPLYGDPIPPEVQPGDGYYPIPNSFGYNYVIDVQWQTETGVIAYDIYAITEADLVSVYYNQNEDANPFRLLLPTTYVPKPLFTGTTSMVDLGKDDYNGLTGGQHYGVAFDIAAVLDMARDKDVLYAHFTQECGNDLLMGRQDDLSVPDAGTMVLLLGLGLSALGWVRGRVS